MGKRLTLIKWFRCVIVKKMWKNFKTIQSVAFKHLIFLSCFKNFNADILIPLQQLTEAFVGIKFLHFFQVTFQNFSTEMFNRVSAKHRVSRITGNSVPSSLTFELCENYCIQALMFRSCLKNLSCWWCITASEAFRSISSAYMPICKLANNKQSLYYFIATVNIKRKVKAKMILGCRVFLSLSLSFSHLFFSLRFRRPFDSNVETIIASISSAYAYWKLFVRNCV